jgi:hypothetical protein
MSCRTCYVSFRTPDGRMWCHVAMAHTVFEAVTEGLEFFNDPFWRGPIPNSETVFQERTLRCSEGWIGRRRA